MQVPAQLHTSPAESGEAGCLLGISTILLLNVAKYYYNNNNNNSSWYNNKS